ncbi:site-specific integrase [Streptomyces sp. JH010]|uniref:site-specific integrase n=1 Tax=Streptomyces TaxID=1883 RepID=UPI0023F9F344|nr:site-specific integrase [Streptomyces sp. JH010]MDF6066763.1 site-specific integrase [Streptomyces sp. JH010]
MMPPLNPRRKRVVSPFVGAQLCPLFGFALPPGRTGPYFDQDRWPFDAVIGLPAYLRPNQRALDFTPITHPEWRLTAKEYIAALMAPRHDAVRDLAHAERTVQTLTTCHGKLSELIRWFRWLTEQGITDLEQVTNYHCTAYVEFRGERLGNDGEVVADSASTRAVAMGAVIGLAQYRQLFSGQRFRDELRPFDGASAAAGSGRTAEVAGANKVQPLASEVQQPLLAAVLYMIQTLAPHILMEAESKRQRQAADRSITATKHPSREAFQRNLERRVETGEPLELMSPLAEQGAQVRRLREESDPLGAVSLSALARECGTRQFRGDWLPLLRPDLERALALVGACAPYGRHPAEVERADGKGHVAWTEPLFSMDLKFLVGYLATACGLAVAALAGMRHCELGELVVGCRQPPQEITPGLFRYRLTGKLIKGQPLGGVRDEWVVTREIYEAIEVAEQLLGPDATPGTSLFHPVFCDTTYQNFRTWVNGPAGQRLGLAPIPEGAVTPRALRRTLAVEIAYRPGGLLAAKLHLKHLSVVTTEGYAARPGGAQAKFLAEINELEEERNIGILSDVYRDYQRGIMPSGPGARDLISLFASVDGRLSELSERAPHVIDNGDEVVAMLAARARTLHLGAANYCWFIDPAKALCLRLAGTPDADRPLAGMCDSARCPQATHHPCHRSVWAESRETAKVFIGSLSRRQKSERARLEVTVARAERVLAEIDQATAGASGKEEI